MAVENHEIMSPFLLLPEECMEVIVSFTTPKDACRISAVSLGIKSAAESDVVWSKFLPPDYENVIARSVSPVAYSTKRELYFMLSDSPLLLDGGKLSFRLSQSCGKKCYTLSARELYIAWGNEPTYWQWISLPDSRFAEVAELQTVCWLEIRGIFQAEMLSPDTNYAAYLVFKLTENQSGLEYATKASIKLVKEDSAEVEEESRDVYLIRVPLSDVEGRVPRTRRTDDWMELQLGEFFVNGGGDHKVDIQVQLCETENLNWKNGLIVEGIEVRPKEEI